MSLNNFVETIKPENTDKLILLLDSKIYPNEFGISVRPLQVKDGSMIIDMKQLIDIFGKVPYITIKETKYRNVYREPMIMTISLKQCTYEEHTFYKYYIDKLCLKAELKRYEKIYDKAMADIKAFKEISNENADMADEVESLDDLRNN